MAFLDHRAGGTELLLKRIVNDVEGTIECCHPGAGIIVSMPVAQYLLRHRNFITCDPSVGAVYCPDTGPDSVVRSRNGAILGVKRLVCYYMYVDGEDERWYGE